MDRLADVTAYFEAQADACDNLGSPFTARLCRILPQLVAGTATGERLFSWPGDMRADALALRLTGGFHRLVIAGMDHGLAAVYPPHEVSDEALRAAVAQALAHHDAFLAAHLDGAPQTNEVARSAMLLPGFLDIARRTGLPLALCEIGSSAGLNLFFDRFHYAYGDAAWGNLGAAVRFAPELRGPAPDLSGKLSVASRHGCDIRPIDIASGEGRLRLRSYIWPDQKARLARLAAAIDIAKATPFSLETEDAAQFVAKRLEERLPRQVFVLFHSIMWQYMPVGTHKSITKSMEAAGKLATEHAPIAWVSMEPTSRDPGHAILSVTLWPDGEKVDLAKCDFHGRWIEML